MWKGTMFADEIGNLSRRCLGYFRCCNEADPMIVVVPTCQFGHRAVTRLRPGGGGRREFHSSAARNRGDRIRPRNREAAAYIPTCSSTSDLLYDNDHLSYATNVTCPYSPLDGWMPTRSETAIGSRAACLITNDAISPRCQKLVPAAEPTPVGCSRAARIWRTAPCKPLSATTTDSP